MNMKSFKCAQSVSFGVVAFACLLSGVSSSVGEIIPADRRINWDPGIPGGIPARTTIYKTLDTIDKTGGSDVTSAIQSALNSCPANQVVMLPAGTFRINGTIVMPNNVTLRGAGSSTVLKSYGGPVGLFQFGTSGIQWDPTSISTGISSGATAGSTSISVASSSGISVGSYLVITEVNDSSYVSIDGTLNGAATWVDGWSTAGTRARGQIVEVTSVSGNTVGFTPALYSSYTHTPWATHFTAGCKWSGVEDLKTYANNTGCQRNFLFQCAAYCWLKNVECDYTDGDHVSLDWSYRCEIRHSYFHDAYVHTSGSYDNMIGLRTKTSACLVIDNIIRRLHVAIMCEWGAAGNVIAYNYDEGNFDQATASGNRWLPVSMNSNHGAHPQFNLFEGNVSQKFQADSYWGSSSDCVVFRNYFSGSGVAHPPYTGRGTEDTSTTAVLIQGNRAVDVWELQSTHSIVGNVIGDASLKARSVVRKVVNPAGRAYDNPPYCFSYGYTSESSGGGSALQNPTSTLIEHGNYDIAGGSIVWDSSISDHAIPNSMFLTSKPAWFGNLAWPPIDPSRPSVTPASIPAGYRYLNGVDPSGGTTPGNQPPVASASVSTTSGTIPLAVTFSSSGSSDPEGTALTYSWNFGDGSSSTSANPSHTYTTAGTYSAKLTVSDGTNSTTSSTITITASALINLPPVAVAIGSPLIGVSPLAVTFSSAGSSDPEGASLTYSWNFGDGTTSTSANPSHTYSTAGAYLARLTVSDGVNSTTSVAVGVTVTALPSNQPPLAVAGATPKSGAAPLNVTFSSAGSSDPEGTALTYSWNFGDGTTSTSANPSHSYSLAGDYTAQLTVSDGTNTSVASTVAISVTGLIAAYGFEETSGSTATDAVAANRSAGTITTATRVTGRIGKGLSFNGTDSLVAISNTTAVALSSNMTLEAWVNPATTDNTWMPVIFKPYNSSQISYVVQGRTPQNGVPCVYVSPSANNVLASTALPTNTWSHLAATYDGATIRLYTNGVLAASQAQTGVIPNSSEPLTIGGNALFQAYWKGSVDEVRVYNRALSASEIKSDMTNAVVATAATPPAAPLNLHVIPQ